MKYFTLKELCFSSTAQAKKIDNTPDSTEAAHIIELIEKLLDPIREKWAAYCKANNLGTGAININSGFRCPQLNAVVGGVRTSAHLVGYAADIKPANGKQLLFEKWIAAKFAKSGVKFDQIILERSRYARWVHVAIRNQAGAQRMKCFSLSV